MMLAEQDTERFYGAVKRIIAQIDPGSGLIEDREFLDIMSWHFGSLDRMATQRHIKTKTAVEMKKQRTREVMDAYLEYEKARERAAEDNPQAIIAEELGVSKSTISHWLTGRKPRLISQRRFAASERRRKSVMKEAVVRRIKKHTLTILDGNRQNIIHLKAADFERFYRDLKMCGLEWYEALELAFPRLAIAEWDLPFASWMLESHFYGKWSVENRIAYSLAVYKKRGGNVAYSDFPHRLRRKMGEIYGTISYIPPLIEAGLREPRNEKEASVRRYAIRELLKSGRSTQFIDNIFNITARLRKMGIIAGQQLTEEAKARLRPQNRMETVLGLRLMGYSLQEIADIYGVERERIRQIGNPIYDSRRALRLTARALKRKGISTAELDEAFPDLEDYKPAEVLDFCRQHAHNPRAISSYTRTIGSYVRHRNELHRYQASSHRAA